MQFELTKEFLHDLSESLQNKDSNKVEEVLEHLAPVDIAEIIDELDLSDACDLFRSLTEDNAALVFPELDTDVRVKIAEALSSKEIADKVFRQIDSDDAADVLAELSESKKEEIIGFIEDVEQASDIVDLLTYDEHTAGGLMAKELVRVKAEWSISECIAEVRKQAEEVDPVYTVYVVDNNDRLVGRLSLKKLLLTPDHYKIKDIFESDFIAVNAHRDSEEVAGIMDKYDLVVIPVIDDLNRLIGRITIDDVVDVIVEEAEKDYQLASGIAEKVESSDSIWRLSRARLPWLMIGLVGGIMGAKVIGHYEEDIARYTQLAFFIPLIAAMGGNVGVQSSAIIVQGLANNTLGMDSFTRRLFKEFLVAIINGLACSAAIFGFNYIFADDLMLSITVSVALMSVVIFAALFGSIVPLALDKYNIDPALATGPFITTANDVLGLFLYFVICNQIYI